MITKRSGIMKSDKARPEYGIISDWVREGSSVLDLGCGEGDLLYLLTREKKVRGQGIEKDEDAIYRCVEKGINVSHGDIDSGLRDYNDGAFDYCILNRSLQETIFPDAVLGEAFRVGGAVIVGFPNFAHCKARYQLAVRGIAPVTASLPYRWFNSPNLHFLSIQDFVSFCSARGIRIEKRAYFAGERRAGLFPNFLADQGVFLLRRAESGRQRGL